MAENFFQSIPGWSDVGYSSAKEAITPNIDKLVNESVVLNQSYGKWTQTQDDIQSSRPGIDVKFNPTLSSIFPLHSVS